MVFVPVIGVAGERVVVARLVCGESEREIWLRELLSDGF